MRRRDTQICFRAIEDLNSSEKVCAYQVPRLFCEDHACKFRFHLIKYIRHGELATGLDAADRSAQTAEGNNTNRIELKK